MTEEIPTDPDVITWGITSRTMDGYHVLLADFDHTLGERLRPRIEAVQEDEGLPPVYLFDTAPDRREESWHALCFRKFRSDEVMRLMRALKADAAHAGIGGNTQRWTIRVGPKLDRKTGETLKPAPEHVETILGPRLHAVRQPYGMSRAHQHLYREMHEIPIWDHGEYDEGEHVEKEYFGTRRKKGGPQDELDTGRALWGKMEGDDGD